MPMNDSFTSNGDDWSLYILKLLRVLAVGLGFIAILMGLYYAIRLFSMIHSFLTEPQNWAATVENWASILSLGEQEGELIGSLYPGDRAMATLVVFAALFLLVWVAIGLMTAGARILSWLAGDTESMKRLLKQVFNPAELERLRRGSESHDGT